MRFGILGSTLVVGDDQRPAALSGSRLRALTAALALREGRAAQPWALIEEIWGDGGPADPQDALQTLVARLRRALGAAHVGSGPEGYRLIGGDTDAAAFRALAAEAATAAPARAAALLRDALALWRGPALADLPAREDAARRLEAERTAARRALAEAELALGHAATVLPDVAEQLAAEPLDESWQLLHLRALHATGRTAEALRAYDSFRHLLSDQLGTDPGPALRATHAQLLTATTAPPADARRVAAVPRSSAAPRSADAQAYGSAASAAPGPGNLPRRLTSFVGREGELELLGRELPGARVLTLTGPGGTGKTRLAQQAAGAAAGAYPDGVWQVELAPLDDPRAVVDAALGALGLRSTHLGLGLSESLTSAAPGTGEPEGPLGRLLEFCGPRTLLLVLDNCEHLVQAAAELAERLVAACPGVTVLATSREPLGVPGELVRPLDPLPEPTALRLLAERGAAARPGFDPADPAQDPEACAEICRRLDGLPLAIELAAARLRAMTSRQLADRLDHRFALLTGGNRTDLPRQQTLRAVVDWSWELLEKSERTLLARLSVFAGGWTLDAAEAVCADQDDLPPEEVAPCLLSLVDKSLIQADLTADTPEPRYRMLETIHEYAAERLCETADPSAPALAHLRWFRELARATDPLLRSEAQLDALWLLDTEHDNLRAALRRAIEAGEEQEALSLLCNLGWYWMLRNQRDEAREWTRAVRALVPGDPFDVPAVPVSEGPGDLPPPWPQEVLEEARRVVSIGVFLTAEGAFGGVPDEEMRQLGARIVDCYRPELPQSARLPALQRVYVVMYAGLLEQLQSVANGLVDGCRRFGRSWELACALQARAKLLNDRPDEHDQAAADAAESLELFTAIGDRWGRAEAFAGLAEVANFTGDFAEGIRCSREAIALAGELGADQEQPILRVRLGDALLGLGRIEEGEAELLGGINDSRAYGVIGQGAGMFGTMLLAGLRMRQQRLGEARELLEGLLSGPLGAGVAGLLNGLISGLLGSIDAMDGDPEGGLRRIRAGLEQIRSHPLVPFAAEQLPLVLLPSLTGALWRCARAGILLQERPARTAALLLGAYGHLQSRSAAHHLDRQALDEVTAGLRTLLGEEEFEAAYREGETLDVREATRLMYGE